MTLSYSEELPGKEGRTPLPAAMRSKPAGLPQDERSGHLDESSRQQKEEMSVDSNIDW